MNPIEIFTITVLCVALILCIIILVHLSRRLHRWRKTRKPGDLCRIYIGEEKVDGKLIRKHPGDVWFIQYRRENGDIEFTFRFEQDIYP